MKESYVAVWVTVLMNGLTYDIVVKVACRLDTLQEKDSRYRGVLYSDDINFRRYSIKLLR